MILCMYAYILYIQVNNWIKISYMKYLVGIVETDS